MVRAVPRGRALWVLAGGMVISVFISGGAVRRYWVRHHELVRLEERRSEMRRRFRTLEARRVRAEHDEAFIETAARRELGLVGPDEIEFRFVDAVSSGSSNASDR